MATHKRPVMATTAKPKRPHKGPNRAKGPTAAELDGIRTRSAAAHGGKARSEADILQTWKNNQARQAEKKLTTMRAGVKDRIATRPSPVPGAKLHGNPMVNGLPGRSALAPGRRRGNPTPGENPNPQASHRAAASLPKPPKMAPPEARGPRQYLPTSSTGKGARELGTFPKPPKPATKRKLNQ